MSWVLRVFGWPIATVDYEGEEEPEYAEEIEGITGGPTHDFERGDNLTVNEVEGESWYEESDFGFRRP